MSLRSRVLRLGSLPVVFLQLTGAAFCGTATNISGFYYTGVNNTYGLLSGGSTDSHWTVTYARVNGQEYTGNSTYTGAAYVVSPDYVDSAWVDNTSSSQWITAPGAKTASSNGTANSGGDYLPGNGTTSNSGGRSEHSAYYVYRLAFTISGNGNGNVSNNVSISLTLAADDRYTVYVNPASAPTVNSDGTIDVGNSSAVAARTNAWNNTQAITLQNYGAGANSQFVIGTNYLYVVVANTNSQTGYSSSSSLNPSGLLVYQVGTSMTIDGKPVPEVGAWLPVAGAVGIYLLRRVRRRGQSEATEPSSPAV